MTLFLSSLSLINVYALAAIVPTAVIGIYVIEWYARKADER